MPKEDPFIFKCKMGVTFDKGNKDSYAIWLFNETECKWMYGFPYPTIKEASDAFGVHLPEIISVVGRGF